MPLDLNTTLLDIEKMLPRLLGDKAMLLTKPYPEPLHVQADPVLLGQALMNLAVNARDAMSGGGRITIHLGCRHIKDGECGKPGGIQSGEFAKIAVSDTGEGIPEEILGHIFEPFFSTKTDDKGAGLGLSIVKSIMKQHGGFIDVQTKRGAGSTFCLYLPMGVPETGQAVEAEPVPDEAPVADQAVAEGADSSASETDGAIILLVEDDPMIRTLVCQTLEIQGYTVLQAAEGWEGIKEARNYKGKIDLLFTDVMMPGLGGAELALAARELYPEIKVLFMSGYSRTQLEEEGVPLDAEVLEKPFTPDKVAATVRKLLAN